MPNLMYELLCGYSRDFATPATTVRANLKHHDRRVMDHMHMSMMVAGLLARTGDGRATAYLLTDRGVAVRDALAPFENVSPIPF